MYKLIIADDELSIRIGLSELNWDIFGIELAAAFSNGQEAYDYIINNEADIVLTDIKMPVMDGLELAEKINALKSGIIVIMLTGFDDFEYIKHCLKNNVFDYLLKPLSGTEWYSTFERAVNELKQRKPQNSPEPTAGSKNHIVQAALSYTREHYAEHITLTTVAESIHTNPSYLSRILNEELNMGFTDLITKYRMEAAKELLKNPLYKINDITQMLGYKNPRYFTRLFKEYSGFTPFSYRSENHEQ